MLRMVAFICISQPPCERAQSSLKGDLQTLTATSRREKYPPAQTETLSW